MQPIKLIVDLIQDKDTNRIFPLLFETRYRVSDMDVTPRVLSHWRKEGLIDIKDHKWMKVNLLDYFWLNVLIDLRSLGIPISILKRVKEQLYDVGSQDMYGPLDLQDSKKGLKILEQVEDVSLDGLDDFDPNEFEDVLAFFTKEMNLFKILSTIMLVGGTDVLLYVNSLGDVDFTIDKYSNLARPESKFQQRIPQDVELCVPLIKYLYKVTTDLRTQPKVRDLGFLEPIEMDVLEAMRKGECKELRIIMGKKGEKDLVLSYNGRASEEEAKKVVQQFFGKTHVALEMKSSDGRTVSYHYQTRKRYT